MKPPQEGRGVLSPRNPATLGGCQTTMTIDEHIYVYTDMNMSTKKIVYVYSSIYLYKTLYVYSSIYLYICQNKYIYTYKLIYKHTNMSV